MRFHVSPEKIRADEWVLFEQTLQRTGAGRALVTGRVWSRGGELGLSFSQELLVRIDGARPLPPHAPSAPGAAAPAAKL